MSRRFFIPRGGGGHHPAVQLRVAAHRDVKPAVHFIAAVADAARAGHGAEAEAAACADVLLAAVVAVGVLFAGNGQVTPDIGQHALPADLRSGEIRIAAADDRERIPRVNRGFGVGEGGAVLLTFPGIHAGGKPPEPTPGLVEKVSF